MKKIMLDCSRLKERDSMRDYMTEIFCIADEAGFTGNLDHLNDLLSEVTLDITLCVSFDGLEKAAETSFSWKVLRVLILAARENPHITVTVKSK